MQFNPTDNYFQLLGVKPVFNIRQNELTAHHQKLQSVLHPDRYVTASPQERRIATQNAALVNEAYRVLTDDCERAIYLLKLKGTEFNLETDTTCDPDFLMEQMELRETIELPETTPRQLSDLKELLNTKINELGCQFNQAHVADDFEQARSEVIKMQFFKKLAAHIEDKIRCAEDAMV